MTTNQMQYHDLLVRIMSEGEDRTDRTGVGTRSVFGHQMRFDLKGGFPLLTTKRVHTKSIFGELLWFLSGSTNNNDLREMGVTIWDEWADAEGNLGPVYGSQWRSWGRESIGGFLNPIDQISNLVDGIRNDPFSRRHIVTAWNPHSIEHQALPPCHVMFQFYVHADANGDPAELSCQLYQRSADAFLGVPFNIASYAALTMMVAQQTGLAAREFVHTLGDAHIYSNHFEQVVLQLRREPRPDPELHLVKALSMFDYRLEDFIVEGYDPHPAIKAPVAV